MGTVTLYKHDGSAYKTLYHVAGISVDGGVLTVLYKTDPTDLTAFKIKTTLPFLIDYDEKVSL